jgi:hypothetical protein
MTFECDGPAPYADQLAGILQGRRIKATTDSDDLYQRDQNIFQVWLIAAYFH